MNKIDEIKQTLAKANKLPWKIDSFGAVVNNNHELVQWYDGKAVVSEKEDSHLIANAPEWLHYLIGEVKRLEVGLQGWKERSSRSENALYEIEAENEALRKALERIANGEFEVDIIDFEGQQREIAEDYQRIARQALGREANHE